MSRSPVVLGFLFSVSTVLLPAPAQAQPLGTFRWQLQPYCNVVTLSVTQTGGVYTLDGFDDQCGAANRAPVTGTAAPNADGTIEIGLNIVGSPDAAPLHVIVSLDRATLGGPWKDSAGGGGTFAFAPNGSTGGSPRPASGPARIGAIAVDPTEVQLRVSGSCPSGQFMRMIHENGSVACAAAGAGAGGVTAVYPGAGLAGGGLTGDVTLSLRSTAAGAFDFGNPHGFASAGTIGLGSLGASGAGTRLVWYPGKAAFRAGIVEGVQWNDASIGERSVAFNNSTTASGLASAAFGSGTTARGISSAAFGHLTAAGGNFSVAMGHNTSAGGNMSFAMGDGVLAGGLKSVAMGHLLDASGEGSVVLGSAATTTAGGSGSFVYGDRTLQNQLVSFAPNEFLVRARGGTRFYSNANHTSGVSLAPGASAWASVSDVNLKEHFRDLDGDDVLAKLAEMPIREWSYTSQDASIRHVGPTAQDFFAAFGLGEDPLRISTIDADGIALRAIQALEARTQALADENSRLRTRTEALAEDNRELTWRLDAIERRLRKR